MKKLAIGILGWFILQSCPGVVLAQNPVFLKEGTILFEKRTNSYALVKDMSDAGGMPPAKVDDYKSKNPQFKTEQFALYFNKDKTRFEPAGDGGAQATSIDEWFSLVAGGNVVYSDLSSGHRMSLKQVFGNKYLETDSVSRTDWKITAETREIAGFHCRRADAIIHDSIYVVAFYTIEIPVSGGPESLSGLPGMILGLALPREHVTWFATRALKGAPPTAKLSAPAGGKAVTGQQFSDVLVQTTKGWNKAGALIMRKALL